MSVLKITSSPNTHTLTGKATGRHLILNTTRATRVPRRSSRHWARSNLIAHKFEPCSGAVIMSHDARPFSRPGRAERHIGRAPLGGQRGRPIPANREGASYLGVSWGFLRSSNRSEPKSDQRPYAARGMAADITYVRTVTRRDPFGATTRTRLRVARRATADRVRRAAQSTATGRCRRAAPTCRCDGSV
jgi:hypothetical protein